MGNCLPFRSNSYYYFEEKHALINERSRSFINYEPKLVSIKYSYEEDTGDMIINPKNRSPVSHPIIPPSPSPLLQ